MIHPHHPYYGQRLEVLGHRTGADPLIYVRLPDGTKSSVEPEWVSDSMDSDRPTLPVAHLLRFDGLYAVARLIEQMRRGGHSPKSIGEVPSRRG